MVQHQAYCTVCNREHAVPRCIVQAPPEMQSREERMRELMDDLNAARSSLRRLLRKRAGLQALKAAPAKLEALDDEISAYDDEVGDLIDEINSL